MTQSSKIRVAVLYGGRSSEHDVSRVSAKNIISHLDKNKFTPIPIGIDKNGAWFFNELSVIVDGKDDLLVHDASSISAIPHADPNQEQHFDVVFPVLHGKWGEDGTVQGLLDLTNIPYVGCGVLASAICMDKDMTNRLVEQLGIPVPPYQIAHQHEKNQVIIERVKNKLTLPIFVKPANVGSSVGISKVNQWDDLDKAISKAFAIDKKIILEQALNIRDVEMSVLQNKDGGLPLVSDVAGEVINQKADFYSFEAKCDAEYFPTLDVPANVSAEQLSTMQEYSQRIFLGLECQGLARIDYFIEKETGRVYLNEVNTMPGFTKMSLYPRLWEASGMEFTDLLTYLIELAL